MDLIGIAAIITAIGTLLFNATKLADMNKRLEEYKRRENLNRTDLITLGEQLQTTRSDAAKMALLIDQLFRQYQTAIGKPPDVDLKMIQHMRELYYVTGPLGPIDVQAIKQQT